MLATEDAIVFTIWPIFNLKPSFFTLNSCIAERCIICEDVLSTCWNMLLLDIALTIVEKKPSIDLWIKPENVSVGGLFDLPGLWEKFPFCWEKFPKVYDVFIENEKIKKNSEVLLQSSITRITFKPSLLKMKSRSRKKPRPKF